MLEILRNLCVDFTWVVEASYAQPLWLIPLWVVLFMGFGFLFGLGDMSPDGADAMAGSAVATTIITAIWPVFVTGLAFGICLVLVLVPFAFACEWLGGIWLKESDRLDVRKSSAKDSETSSTNGANNGKG